MLMEMMVMMVMMVINVFTVERAVVSTLAGGVSGATPSYADGSGANAGFSYPGGVAVDASGNVFVADSLNQCIRKVTADGGTRISRVPLCACCLKGAPRGCERVWCSLAGASISIAAFIPWQ